MSDKEKSPFHNLQELQIDDEKTSKEVAEAIADGELVVINFSGKVYAAIFDPRDPRGLAQAIVLKERNPEKQKPFSVLADFEAIGLLGDQDKVDTALYTVLTGIHHNGEPVELPEQIQQTFRKRVISDYGDKCFFRFSVDQKKIKKEKIPPEILGIKPEDRNTMHLVSVEGNESYIIQKKILEALQKKYPGKVPIVGITSFNESGKPSIKDKDKAQELAKMKGISLLVHTKKTDDKQGSYTIIWANRENFGRRYREGNDPTDFVEIGRRFFENLLEILNQEL